MSATPASCSTSSPPVLAEPDRRGSAEFRGDLFGTLGDLADPALAVVLLDAYPDPRARAAPPRRRPARPSDRPGARRLLEAIGRGAVPIERSERQPGPHAACPAPTPSVASLVRHTWGTVREGRDPAREQVLASHGVHLDDASGDPLAGRTVFERVCAQCHQIYGKGEQVGPDLTGNGRGSYDQLLSNVLDPSLVIGAAYQATIVATADGRILTGLLEEDSDRRVVLKLQGGKREVIPRDQVDAMKISPVSLMPENLEEQISPQELADLFAFLSLDRSPEDPAAEPIDGTPDGLIALDHK